MEYIEDKSRFHYQSAEMKELNVSYIKKIYSRITDDESRMIFINRLLFSMTDDWYYIRDMIKKSDLRYELDRILMQKKNKPMFIYGAGIAGKRIPNIFVEYDWLGYIDKKKEGETCNQLPVYGTEKCRELANDIVVLISNMSGVSDIKEDLLSIGVHDENIVVFSDYTNDVAKSRNMYFDNEILDKTRMLGKAFVDAGAYDGSDTVRFFNWINNKDVGAVVFEADSKNYELVKGNLSRYGNVKLYSQGLSDKREQKSFTSGQGEMSNFSCDGDSVIQMTSLDAEISNCKVGFIKMDIEGSEKDALIGARNIISKQKPILAISVYHKREDIWEIPTFILEINPKYNFCLRHYSLGTIDTVLYAY